MPDAPDIAAVHTIHAPSLPSGEGTVAVVLPEGYAASQSRYPVLYLLHGFGDDHLSWSNRTRIAAYATRHRVIAVMPAGGMSFYLNAATRPKQKYEDFIAADVVRYIDTRFRTIPLPAARAIAGASMGGFGAAFLGLKHAHLFSALGAFSGALTYGSMEPRPAKTEDDRLFAENILVNLGPPGAPGRASRDVFKLVETLNPAAVPPLIYIACGAQDFLIESNRAFVRALAARQIPYHYSEVSPRDHTWEFWDECLAAFLKLLDAKPGWKLA